MEALTSAKKLVQALVLTQFQEDVDVFSIFEEVLEAYDVVVVQTAVDFDFRHKLLLGPALGQSGLGDNFCC